MARVAYWAPPAAVVAAGVLAGLWLHSRLASSDDPQVQFAAAFADGETDPANFDQTRHAGVAAMRDDPGEDWDAIDEMADASFPSSDPPSFNPGIA
jgi:hypothetical protein